MSTILIILVSFLCGYGASFVKIPRGFIKSALVKENHLEPRYYRYFGDYANINSCSSCGIVGLYADLHEVNPCFKCGGKVKRNGVGKWVEKDNLKQWIKNKL